MTSHKLQPTIEDFNELASFCEARAHLTVHSDIQVSCIDRLKEFACRLGDEKTQAVDEGDEDVANAVLALECMVDALVGELAMLIQLKNGDPGEAWMCLIDAQEAAKTAIQVHEAGEHMETYAQKLHLLERLLFPPQVFTSLGLVAKRSLCSLCHSDYNQCEHVAGKVYWGRRCVRIISESEIREVSFVTDPADKRCRVTTFSIDGVETDMMTLVPLNGEQLADTEALSGKAVIATAR